MTAIDNAELCGSYTAVNCNLVVDVYHAYENESIVAGRIKQLKVQSDHIAVTFYHTQFRAQCEFFIYANDLGSLSQLKRGDIIGIKGLRTRRQTLDQVILLNRPKSFPLEDDWAEEMAWLHREADVVLDKKSMQTVLDRSRIIFGIRSFMQRCGFCEIELPILKQHPDIAPAPQFEITNSADVGRLYLRTTFPAFERLLVGLNRVYSLGPNFRKGDFSYKNLPEFQMFCMATAFKDYQWAARLIERMIATVARAVNGTTKVEVGGKQFDLASWDHVPLRAAFENILGCEMEQLGSDEALIRICRVKKVVIPRVKKGLKGHMLMAVLFDALFEQRIVGEFTRPTFFCEVPWYLAGPAEPSPSHSLFKLRGEGYVGGVELMNAKCILTSAEKTHEWHESVTAEKRRLKFKHFSKIDRPFLKAIGFGLMPGALASFGVDRLVMMLLKKTCIMDVTPYPLTKSKRL